MEEKQEKEESIEEALNADTELGLPNAASLEAMEDAKNGVGPVYETVNECLDALNAQAKKLADDPHEKKVLDWIEKVSDYEGWKA